MDSDCPCCAPPWAFVRGIGVESLYVSGTEGNGAAGVIFKVDETGAHSRFFPASPGAPLAGETIYAICSDRKKNCYFSILGSFPKIFCVESTGILKWSVSVGYYFQSLAVGLDGYLYGSELAAARVHKFDAENGVEILTGGWPLSTTNYPVELCLDKVNNLYTGEPVANGGIVTKYDSSLSVLWQTVLSSAGSTTRGSIAINEENTDLMYCHTGPLIGHLGLEITAMTGAVLTHPQIMFTQKSDYSPDGSPVNLITNLFVNKIDRNWSAFFSTDVQFHDVACGYDDSIYTITGTTLNNNRLTKINPVTAAVVWSWQCGANNHIDRCIINTGRIGAFGFR